MNTYLVVDWLSHKIISNNVIYDETKAKALAFEQLQKYKLIHTDSVQVIKLEK